MIAESWSTPAPALAPDLAPAPASRPVRFDRRLARRTLLLTLLLCWPLLLFGRPAYFPDTGPYYKGGRVALQFVAGALAPAPASRPVTGSAPAQDGAAGGEVRGARSIPYSVAAYLLRGPGAAMIPLAMFQAGLVGFAIAVVLAVLEVGGARWWGIAALLVFTTPAAWFTSYAMPDIFAGITIIAIAVMTVFPERLSRSVTIVLAVTGAFAIAAHPSHVALALVLLPLALLWAGSRRFSPWLAAPVALGIAAVVISGVVGFHQVSLAPLRFPLTLARGIDDGPVRWYLDAHCRDRHYAVCELYPRGIPQSGGDFLWGPDGIRNRASAAQMNRIRSEEFEILLAAAAAYPARQATDLGSGIARQLVKFDITEASFNLKAIAEPDGTLHLVADPRLSGQAIAWANWLSRISAATATIVLIAGLVMPLGKRLGRARGEHRKLAGLLLAGIIANAAICAILSGADDRYQARVIWLLPLAAVAAWAPGRWRRYRPEQIAS